MTTKEAYDYQCSRLTPEQLIQLGTKEHNIGRELAPYEIVSIFRLEKEEKRVSKRRLSDEVESQSHWSDQ